MDKEKVISYSLLINKFYKEQELPITILHDYKEKIDTNAYDVNIFDKKGVKIGYQISAALASGGTDIRNYKTPKIRISKNEENTILFFPLIVCRASGRSATYRRLDVQKGKYYLYVTYNDKDTTYYSDTIPLYVKRKCK